MDNNERRIALHKAGIMRNIYNTTGGEVVEKGENITVEEFQERLEKGEKFMTPADVERFQSDVKVNIVKAYNPKDKEEILKKSELELSLLKSVNVTNEIGRSFQFFAIMKPFEELEKGKKANLGEIREWKGKKMQKTANGWVPIGEGKKEGGKDEAVGKTVPLRGQNLKVTGDKKVKFGSGTQDYHEVEDEKGKSHEKSQLDSYKKSIYNAIVNNTGYNKTLNKIVEAIDYAWNNWDDDILETYYEGEKPETPNNKFIENWLENEDFEADGYNVDHLKDMFS